MGDLGDVAARMRAAREAKAKQDGDDRPFDHEESFRLRARMLGVLIRDARVNALRDIGDCAIALNVSPEDIEAWEYGDSVPSLPQIEVLANFLDVPISQFWSQSTLSETEDRRIDAQAEYVKLRTRMIGALLRQAREDSQLSIEALSEATNIAVDKLNSYELGEVPVPMHELAVLASNVRRNMDYFLETNSHLGELLALKEMWKHFTELPEELRVFAANPLNVGYIRIALMFSQMPTDKLREVGESMLDITM